MEKTITLTSDEISSITLAIYDKVMNFLKQFLFAVQNSHRMHNRELRT